MPLPRLQNPHPPAISSATSKPGAVWLVTLFLTTGIVSLLLFNAKKYLFVTKLYEFSDWASNSLFVREAKHGWLLHGHYSRWGFYHPGPGFLDALAAGEALFYDALYVVPTPINGQIIMLGVVLTLFFSFALSIFARCLGRGSGGYRFFLPLALFLAVWHYSAAGGGMIILSTWPAYPLVIVFLCFVVTVAAVASGNGWALPVLVLAAGWLVHNHVAQPLFVVPLTLLAYAGLLIEGWRQRLPEPGSRRFAGVLSAGWRMFPRAHRTSALLLALFILPLAVDATHGGDSNLARILDHLRTYHEPLRKFPTALCYFLTFGSYGSYQPGRADFGHYSAHGMLTFVGLHWRVYALWLAALLGAPALFLAANRSLHRHGAANETLPRNRFIPWFSVVLAATVGLTLFWGMKQDGPMYYFNALFNYSIYFCVALLFAAAVAAALMAWTASPLGRKLRLVISTLLWIAAAAAAFHQADQFKGGDDLSSPSLNEQVRTLERATATLPANATCLLSWQPSENWPQALAVGLQLERSGHHFLVGKEWATMFGVQHVVHREKLDPATPLLRWKIAPWLDTAGQPNQWPLLSGNTLDITSLASLNPAGQSIIFSQDGNFNDFAYYGWAPTTGTWTWSVERVAMLAFLPEPLSAEATSGIDVQISAWAYPRTGDVAGQNMVIQFNGVTLGTVYLPPDNPDLQPVHVRISSALWQQAVTKGWGELEFLFPDAISPANVGRAPDDRPLGGAFHSIEFRPAVVPANAAQPASG